MKSVLYVTTTFPTFAAFIENEVHRLHQRGVRIRVVTLRGVGTLYQPEHAALLPLTRALGDPWQPAALLDLLAWCVRRPQVLLPDVVRLLWASRGSLYALAGHVGYLPIAARVATLLEREDFERVHGAWAHFPATVAYLASRLTGRRFSMAGHAGSDLHRTRAFLAEKARAADFVTCCVRGNAEMLRQVAGPGANVEWLYHGANLARFDGRGRQPAAQPMLLSVGRIAQTKGFDVMARALGVLKRRGRTPRWVLVGDGPQRGEVEAILAAEGVADQVEWPGFMNHDRLLEYYREAWMLVAPSRVLANGRQDGIPNVVIESMAMRVPVVGTRAAGIEEAVVEGRNGALAAPDDPESLADAIVRLLDHPEALVPMGDRAREQVLEGFDVETNFERLWALFQSAARNGR